MSLLSYTELCELVEQNVIGPVEPSAINAASIDVRLGDEVVIEQYSENYMRTVDIHKCYCRSNSFGDRVKVWKTT